MSPKLARVSLAEQLSDEPGFVVMGDDPSGRSLIVYVRSPIPGLPSKYKGYRVESIPISTVRFTVEAQEDHERRRRGQG